MLTRKARFTVHCSSENPESCRSNLSTTPRLELIAATLSAKIADQMKKETSLNFSRIVFWTDSTIVLQNIRNMSVRQPTFESNRYQQIHDRTSARQWHHVPTHLNPADIASRGLKMSETDKVKMWLHGPDYLWQTEEFWPKEPPGLGQLPPYYDYFKAQGQSPSIDGACSVAATVLKKSAGSDSDTSPSGSLGVAPAATNRNPMTALLSRFSKWMSLCRSVAWLLRLQCTIRPKLAGKPLPKGPLLCEEIKAATVEVVKLVQREVFPKELELLKGENMTSEDVLKSQRKSLPSSSLKKLSPILVNGVLRVGGRLEHAPISFDAKYPMILPSHNHVTSLIVSYYHTRSGHVGPSHVLLSLCEMFG